MTKTINRRDWYTPYEDKGGAVFLDFPDANDEDNPLLKRYRKRFDRYQKSPVPVHEQSRERIYLLIMLMHGDFSNYEDDDDEDNGYDFSGATFINALAHICPDYYINPRVPLLTLRDYLDWLKQRKAGLEGLPCAKTGDDHAKV